MKAKIKILSICILLMGFQKVVAQSVMVSGTAFLWVSEAAVAVADVGIEIKLSKSWSTKLSAAGSIVSAFEGYNRSRSVLSLEGRYFFKNKPWHKAFFVGPIAQYYSRESYKDLYDKGYIGIEIKKSNMLGLGLIGGKRIQIFKRLGCEFHGGLLFEIGDRTTNLNYIPSYKPEKTIIDKNHVGIRPFAGFNFYLALGKMNPEYLKRKPKKQKNTEGVN